MQLLTALPLGFSEQAAFPLGQESKLLFAHGEGEAGPAGGVFNVFQRWHSACDLEFVRPHRQGFQATQSGLKMNDAVHAMLVLLALPLGRLQRVECWAL